MQKAPLKQAESYFEQIPGLIIIDMSGTVIYASRQCAEYFRMRKEDCLNRYILDVFPESQMIDGLQRDEPGLAFYNSVLGIGISIQVPLWENGEKVGLMEYDVVQHSELLYELSQEYNRFLDQELKHLASELVKLEGTKYTINNLVGESRAMAELKQQILSLAKTSSTVMITGETGTGKELVAHAVHNLSSRRKERFIKVNASSFPEGLIESELFGYEAGAFTGASKTGKKGKFELADKGTLFIDEINQMPLSVQPKLLRVLQEKEIDRVGGEKPIPVDVRIIAATNENLKEMVRLGTFRQDLYYRLNVIELKVPPLRERMEDLEMIAQSIIEELNVQLGLSIAGIDREGLEFLRERPWRGNVRELHNVIERAMNFTSDNVLHREDFRLLPGGNDAELPEVSGDRLLDEVKNRAEREAILKVLAHFHNNRTKAAEYLNIARPVLYQKMKRLGLK